MKATRNVKLTLLFGVTLLAALVAFALTRAPPRVLGGNATVHTYLSTFGTVREDDEIFQAGEVLPAGVSAMRLSLVAYVGARVRVTGSSGARVLIEGERGPDWTGTSVTVPVKPLTHPVSHVRLCVAIGPNSQPIYVRGIRSAPSAVLVSNGAQPLHGRLGVEYLGAGRGSWWSRALAVARRMGLGHALSGTWVVLLIAALMATLGGLAIWLLLREPPAVPSVAWVCASIALLNGVAWSLIVPAFQGKDEVDHFAYVEQLAENGALPWGNRENGTYSPEQTRVLEGLDYWYTVHAPQTPSISSLAEERTLTRDVHAGASLRGTGEAGVATPEPPLYYALQTIPYALARGNMLTQLQLMRLLSALFGALTALFTLLFLRELLPRAPQLATVGALCVALQPQLASMDGAVSPDSMLYAVTAGVLLCLARAFRRGLTLRLAIALGGLIAIGFATKLNFAGLAIGVFLGLAVLALRGAKAKGSAGTLPAAVAAGIGLAPVMLYAAANALSHHPTFGLASGAEHGFTAHSLSHELAYIWQLYLPRLPGMTPYFAGVTTFRDIWFDRSVGLYGFMDTMFPVWVDDVALVPAALIVGVLCRELFVRRDALRARLPELGVYAAIAVGLPAMVGASSYLSNALEGGAAFAEPRYLVPMIPLLGAVVVLAVRGSGPRWAPVVGAGLVILFLGHDVFSQLQVIARYYG